MQLAKLAVRHVFERVEVTILGRNFHGTAPATGAVEIMAVRIGHLSSIDLDGVIMKPFVQWPRVTVPHAVVAFLEFAALSKRAAHALRFRRDDAELHAAL